MRIRLLLTLSIFLAAVCVFSGSQAVSALSGADYKAGQIIDDSLFFDGATMSVGEIQGFLNSKVPVCDTNGTRPYGGTTRAAYGASRGNPAPYTCLKDYRQNTVNKNAESGLCNGITASNKSSAEIIYEVGLSCGVSPKALIVLLQKEQSLITDDWPWSIQYRSATGYGCPDTAPCDAEFYGFFNQVYAAARQFKRYARNPTSFNYRSGQTSYVLYNPNSRCGGSNISIENSSTAGLYNYTPYQPNQPALNNLYGIGDGCSAYGNRNFWRMYNDWFGTTLGSYLLRSSENATVYLISDENKYPIADGSLLDALYPLGSVKYVSQQYLDRKTTGAPLLRLIRGADGTIYFFDAGIKLAFTSCETIAHYGYTCGQTVGLNTIQLSKLVSGPNMIRIFGTTSGKKFYIASGEKREIFDAQAQQENGISGNANVLNESAIANLVYGPPVMRTNTIAHARFTQTYCLYDLGKCVSVPERLITQTALRSIKRSSLDLQSIQKAAPGGSLRGLVQNGSQTQKFVIDGYGKALIADPSEWADNYLTVSDSLLGILASSPQSTGSRLVKGVQNGTVYLIDSKTKRAISSWGDLLKISSNNPVISTLSDETISLLNNGTQVLGPAMLVKYASNATVYVVDGLGVKIPLSSFLVSSDLGLTGSVRTISDATLNFYLTAPTALTTKIICGGNNYIATKGLAYEIESGMNTHYGFTYKVLDTATCAAVQKSSKKMNRFLLGPDGTIYYVENGQKRAFSSWQSYIDYGGTATNTVTASTILLNSLGAGSNL